MVSPKLFMFFGALFLVGITFSYFIGGVWFGSDATNIMTSLTAFKVYNVFGIFKVPWVNVDFFTVGIPHLVQFDFAFFSGGYGYLRYVMYILSMGFVWGFIAIAINLISGFYTRK